MIPYDDNYMMYDRREHRYVLTENFVREKMNIELSSLMDTSFSVDVTNEARLFLDRVSRTVYGYIYRLCPHRYAKERELAFDEKMRDVLRDAMAEQITYIIFNGDLSLYSGLNASGGGTESSRIRSAEIAPIVRDILTNTGVVRIAVPKREREIEPDYVGENY